jgi:Hemerythrin HHE cation binding domain
MLTETPRTIHAGPPAGPIDRLRWEHKLLLELFGGLTLHAGGDESAPEGIGIRTEKVLKALERHQESEERFLFPLLSELGEKLFGELRKEHGRFLQLSDEILFSARSGGDGTFAALLARMKVSLETHFSLEESGVLLKAPDLLSPAQADILKIKFATRKAMEL